MLPFLAFVYFFFAGQTSFLNSVTEQWFYKVAILYILAFQCLGKRTKLLLRTVLY
jgi:hypothetical protein